MKKFSIWLCTLMGIVLVMGSVLSCGTEAPKEVVILKLGHAYPTHLSAAVAIQEFADRFNELCEGEAEIVVYPARQLGTRLECLEQVGWGTIEMAEIALDHISPSVLPPIAALHVPFLWKNRDAMIAASDELYELLSPVMKENLNVKLLPALNVVGPPLMISTEPMRTLEDWRGLPVVSTDATMAMVLEAMGATPTPIPFLEAYGALEKGIVEATICHTVNVCAMGFHEVTSYWMDITMFPYMWKTFVINPNVFNSLPKHAQEVMLEEIAKYPEAYMARLLQENAECVSEMKTTGVLQEIVVSEA